jgi:hypothetical protein
LREEELPSWPRISSRNASTQHVSDRTVSTVELPRRVRISQWQLFT